MIELKFVKPVEDQYCKKIIQACQILFGSKRDGFEIAWADPETLQIYQSETRVSVKRDFRKE